MAQKPPPTHWGAARVAVRALKDIITRELAEGHPLTAIYARHKARIGVSYERFRVHVAREITHTAGSRGGRLPIRDAARAGRSAEPAPVPSPALPEPGVQELDPPKGSKAWRQKHGVLDRARRETPFVARIPDIHRLVHGDDDPQE